MSARCPWAYGVGVPAGPTPPPPGMPGTHSSCCFSALPTQPKYLHFHKAVTGLEAASPETKWQQAWPSDVCPYFMLRSPPGEQSPSVGADRVRTSSCRRAMFCSLEGTSTNHGAASFPAPPELPSPFCTHHLCYRATSASGRGRLGKKQKGTGTSSSSAHGWEHERDYPGLAGEQHGLGSMLVLTPSRSQQRWGHSSLHRRNSAH